MYGSSARDLRFPSSISEPGLHVFRIEKMKLISVPVESHGVFHSGDTYLLIFNSSEGNSIYVWNGSSTTVDEKAAGAIYSSQLHMHMGEKPTQNHETQGHESVEFMSLFPRGVTYLEGGVSSGFQQAQKDPVAPTHHLYHVRGRKHIRAIETDLKWDSFNTGDCFILDTGKFIYVWSGSQSNMMERNRARDLAYQIRDSERRGAAKVEIMLEGEEPEEMIQILGQRPDKLKEGSTQDDKEADEIHTRGAVLYQVSNATGEVKVTRVADGGTFRKEQLLSDDCFILDTAGKIFVWNGKKANKEEREQSSATAKKFITLMNYPTKTQVQVMSEGNESPLFKQFFSNWL
ncbi:PREDICTED: macrophage-capping protein [Nanorana parkeri]|uniref:macrophage-capping protein n=1 Tax=Nanorana parkeri TaxID=125878 RepID=UPI0008540D98|nr:PREDICTED: macrophage-capping protein [Nanorana parkeri]